jgi:hypothetical protein
VEIKAGPNEIGATTRGTEVAGLTDATIAQGTTTEIRDIEVTGGMATEMDIEETIDRGQGPPEGGQDPGRWITGDGGILKTG